MFYVLFILSYLLGSIPFGFIIARLKGIDIKKVGSGNIGGTNVGRSLGKKYGVLVIIFDALKSFLPTFIAYQLYGESLLTIIIGTIAILGHIFPIWLNFKGGKGVSSGLGIALIILPLWYIGIIAIVWFVILKITKLMSLTDLIAPFLVTIYFLFIHFNLDYLIGTSFIIGIIYWTHRNNIQRLKEGREMKINL